MNMIRTIIALGILASFTLTALAGDCCCPQCGCKVCTVEPTKTKEKKHCFNVECKEICIPGIRLPWQCCDAPPNCGKVRTVKVLVKKEYECEKCGWKWSVKTVGTSCGNGCTNCNGDCANAVPASPETAPQPVPTPEKAARISTPATSQSAARLEVPSVRIADFE